MAVIHLRMLVYSLTLALHGYNLYIMNEATYGPAMQDHDVRTFAGLYKRFFTAWTMFFQIFHAMLGLTCDYLTLKHSTKKEPQLLRFMKSFKSRVFAAVLWPTVFLVSSLFWTLYHYDRSLIYPEFADKILTPTTNHIVHTAVIPIVVLEAVFQPRTIPKKHAVNVTILTVYMLTYLSVMCYTYIDQGVWLYPIFGLAYDTVIYFPIILAVIGVMLISSYHMQWIITRIVWGSQIKIKKYSKLN